VPTPIVGVDALLGVALYQSLQVVEEPPALGTDYNQSAALCKRPQFLFEIIYAAILPVRILIISEIHANLAALNAVIWTRDLLTPANREWLTTLVHGSPRDPIWEYIATPAVARVCLECMTTPICFCGHTHIPAVFRKPAYLRGISTGWFRVDSSRLLTLDRLPPNPGSVGQPRDDDPRAA
jgi:diadenosine tetraphosphatase ApaH/serine/threonine PP2A family protein phosphatase